MSDLILGTKAELREEVAPSAAQPMFKLEPGAEPGYDAQAKEAGDEP